MKDMNNNVTCPFVHMRVIQQVWYLIFFLINCLRFVTFKQEHQVVDMFSMQFALSSSSSVFPQIKKGCKGLSFHLHALLPLSHSLFTVFLVKSLFED